MKHETSGSLSTFTAHALVYVLLFSKKRGVTAVWEQGRRVFQLLLSAFEKSMTDE